MKRKVKIARMPNLKSGAEVKLEGLRAGLGFNANVMPWPIMAGKMSEPDISVSSTLGPVPREFANLEAEKGEVAMVPGAGGIPDTYRIGGKRHYEGGTPLNLPDDSFIFSDTAKMRIKDPAILAQFGMPKRKGGYTPAEIAKKYNTAPYKKILADPNTDDMQKHTAEIMIANYNLKLAKLALIQESMKGFPQGIPNIAMPYIEELGIDPAQFVQMNPGQGDDETAESDMMAYGGLINKLKLRKEGGAFDHYSMPKAQVGQETGNIMNKLEAVRIGNNNRDIIEEFTNFDNGPIIYDNGYKIKDLYGQAYNPDLYEYYKDRQQSIENLNKTQNSVLPGFSTFGPFSSKEANIQNQLEFQNASAQNKAVYDEYKKALASKNATQMLNVAKKIKNLNVPYSLGIAPWTQEDKYQDLAGILEEQAAALSQPKKTVSTKSPYISKLNELEDYFTKKRDRYPASSLDYYNYNNELQKVLNYKKDIDQLNQPMYGLETGMTPQTSIPYDEINALYADKIAKSKQSASSKPKTETRAQDTSKASLQTNYTFPAYTKQAETTTEAKGTTTAPAKKKVVITVAPNKTKKSQRVVVERDGGELQTFANGGTITLYEYSKSRDKVRPVYSDGTKGDWEDQESDVSQQDFDRLNALATAALSKDPTGKSKTPESAEFQREYHKLFPKISRKIIVADPAQTNKAQQLGLNYWDLESNVDEYFGPRTRQYYATLQKLKKKAAEDKAPTTDTEKKKGDTTASKDSEYTGEGLKYEHLGAPAYADQSTPWWLQDQIKLANAVSNYANVNAYYPWQATAPIMLADTVFADPERELAASMEAANIGTQGAAQFAGPQAYNARFSEIQGQAAKNAADIIGRYNNINIGIANQQAARNAEVMNQANQLRAQAATGLYDKYQIAQQQFDNSKTQAKNSVVDQLVQGITNAAYTQDLNSLYPQYAVNPTRGGTIIFHDPKALKAAKETEDPLLANYKKLADKFPGIADKDPYKLLILASKMASGTTNDLDPYKEMLMDQQRGLIGSYPG